MEFAAELQSLVDDDENFEKQPLVPHRTVDEILLLYDSSSSAGSPSPPASPSHSSSPVSSSINGNYATSIRYHDGSPSFSTNHSSQLGLAEEIDNTNISNAAHNNISSRTVSLSSVNSLENSASPTPKLLSNSHSLDSAFFHSSTRLSSSNISSVRTLQTTIPASLPPLFTATKSNAKPGAALAAAAAASRSIPTRLAAAIKSSRSTTPSVAPVLVSSASSNSSPSAYATDAPPPTEGFNDDSPNNFHLTLRGGELKQETGAVEEADSERQFSEPQHFDNLFMEQNLRNLAVEAHSPGHSIVQIDDNGSAGGGASPVVVAPLHSDFSAKHMNFDESATAASIVLEDSQVKQSRPPSSSASHDREDDIDNNPSLNTANLVVQEVLDAEKEKSDALNWSVKDDNADIAQCAHEQQSYSEDTKSTDKKSNQISLSPLEVAEELEKKQAFAGLHLEEGAAAQPMRLEGVRRVSTMLGYFHVDSNNTITRTISAPDFTREHGYPVVLAVHVLYIAIGMSKGIILVVPSKYSPHNSDSMDAKMYKLLQGDRPYGPVTSLCFSQQGDFLFSGYGNGHIAVWDVQKTSAVKVISEHKAPVVHMLYLGQDSQVSKQFNVVSGDSKGMVKLIRFSFFSLVKTYKATVLCDEKMGVVICASSLISSEGIGGELMTSQVGSLGPTSSNWSMIGGAIGVETGSRYSPAAEDGVFIFVFHQYALVAKYVPSGDNVVKYAHFPKPDGVGEGSMPYASWRSVFDSNDSSTETVRAETSKASYLAIAWDRTVQVSKLVKSELKVYAKWTVDCSAVGLAWLDDQMLVILTSTGQLEMFTKDGTMIHETSFSVDVSRGDDLITCHTFFNNSYGNPEKAYHNCVAVRGASIYVLAPSHLVICRLLLWKERTEVLCRGGDWIGALNMAMVLYDGRAYGAIDLPRTLEEIRTTIMPDLVKLVLSYVDEVFSYIKVAYGNQVGNSDQLNKSINSSYDHPEVKEQYIRVGGVAVEFCVHIKRTDILFDEIYTKFEAAQQKETFLELLEPYILKDMLGCLPPEIMQALVEHYSTKGWLQRVEQCVLHMDISSLDFNQVVRLCREHGLHGALIYLFNKGLEDFRTPLEELLVVLQNCESGSASALGYRILVYLKYCFQGLAFPPGHGTLPTTRLLSIKEQILQFLLDVSSNSKSQADTDLPSHGQLPNLCHLLRLDTLSTLNVLRNAFVDGSVNSNGESTEVKVLGFESQNLVQKLVDSLCMILEASYFQRDFSTDGHYSSSIEPWPTKDDAGYMFEFIAYYVAYERAKVSGNTLSKILEYLTSVFTPTPGESENIFGAMKAREKQLLALLDAVPDTDWDALHLLYLCERCQFHQVCGFIHSKQHQYVAALDSYIKAADEPIHAFSVIHDMLQLLSEKEFDSFQAAVISRIGDLVKLDREGAFFVVIHHFYGQSQILFSELQSHPESLFLYMKTLIEVHTNGNVQFSRLMNDGSLYYPRGTIAKHQSDRVNIFLKALREFPKLLHSNPIQLTDEMTELYFELLCQYERESVLKFLETFESYRVENCLRLCQDYGIVDAAAFLLERVGDVGNALSLILSGLNEKFIVLESSIGSTQPDPVSLNLGTVLKEKEARDILDIVHSCIGLCQRNSPRLGSHESESLWFELLDSFCLPLANSCSEAGPSHEPHPQVPDKSLVMQEDEGACRIKQNKSRSPKSSHILRKLRSVFIREIVEAMIGHIDISTIMLKLLSDSRIQEFGDIKPTILGMLGTYDFERRILDTAKSLIEDDTYYTMSLLKKEASHGYAPQDLACCICNCPLSKNSSIQVFSCSHALHVHCAGAVSSGCPICVATKNAHRSSKAVVVDNGLVSKASTTQQKAPRTSSLHSPLDNDVFENSYSHHPVSRFELLNSLLKDERSIQTENMPSLRLAPPAVYHEKVKKGVNLMTAGNINGSPKAERSSRSMQSGDAKASGSSSRFKLRSTIFGKERSSKRLQ